MVGKSLQNICSALFGCATEKRKKKKKKATIENLKCEKLNEGVYFSFYVCLLNEVQLTLLCLVISNTNS